MDNEIKVGDLVKFTKEGEGAFLAKGEDVIDSTFKVVATTETHLSLVWVDGPFPIPGVTQGIVSAKRHLVVKA